MIFDAFASRNLESPTTPLTGEELALWADGINGGLGVTPDTALRLTAVYSCIYILASSLGQLPVSVLRRMGDRIEPGTDHAAHYLLHDEPNEWQTSYKWRETKQAHVLGWGNGLSRIVRTRRGELLSLEPHKPQESSLVQRAGRWLYATLDDDGHPLAVAPEDMVHLRACGSHGKWGTSPILQNAETIGLGLAAQRYGKQFFEGGGKATGLVTLKNGDLKADGWERLKTVWRSATAALKSQENKTLLLPADLDYKQLSIAPEAAQFLETRKLSRSEIAGLFNVPAHMINDLEKATFSNISEQAIQFVRHSIMPWVVNWEQELNRKLFTRAERQAGYYVKFNLGGLLRGTPTERAQFYHYAITDGWMDRNEVRVLEDLNPRDGLSEMLVSVNAQPAAQLGKDPATPEE